MNMRALLPAILLAGCSPGQQAAEQPPLQGAAIGGPFRLVDQDGRAVTDRDFAGRYRIMYFGYTFCPDVCPVDMQMLGAGLRAFEQRVPAKAARVVPVFVSVDPARDAPPVLKQFVRAFHPRMIGLTGTPAQIDAVAKEYGVYHAKGAASPGGYLVDHSRVAYLMDPAGKPLALLPHEGPPEAIAAALEKWIR